MPYGTVPTHNCSRTLKSSVVATDTFELAVANALVRLHPDKGLDLHPNGVSKEKIRRTPIRGSVRLSKFANSCHSYDTAKIDKRFDYTTVRYNHRTHPQERKMRTTQRIVLTVTWGAMWGSNPRHPEPQSGALPTELIAPCQFGRQR